MARLSRLNVEDLTQDQRELYDALIGGPRSNLGITHSDQSLRGPFDVLLRTPSIGNAVQQLGTAIRSGSALPGELRELAILATAAHWNCTFESAAHGPLAESAGVSKIIVEAITNRAPVVLPPRSSSRVVYEAVNELLAGRTIGDDTFKRLLDLLGEQQTVELIVLTGYYALLAMLLETFRIET